MPCKCYSNNIALKKYIDIGFIFGLLHVSVYLRLPKCLQFISLHFLKDAEIFRVSALSDLSEVLHKQNEHL